MKRAEFNREMRRAADRIVDAHQAWLDGMDPYFADAVAGDKPEKVLTAEAAARLDALYAEYREAQRASQELWQKRHEIEDPRT